MTRPFFVVTVLGVVATLGVVGAGIVGYLTFWHGTTPSPHAEAPATPAARGEEPARVTIEIIARYPGAATEEVERQVTIPLEVTLAGLRGLKATRSQSRFGLALIRTEFEADTDLNAARQEVANRVASSQAALPAGVVPHLAPATSREVCRYVVMSPRDAKGQPIYTLHDLRGLQDSVLNRQFRRVPRVADVTSAGGRIKRYEVHLDPDRLRQCGVTVAQVETGIRDRNANTDQKGGPPAREVRGIGLLGGGQDPLQQVVDLKNPAEAAARLRADEERRLREIRAIVVATINNTPVRVEHLVEGGPLGAGEVPGRIGVLVGSQPPRSSIALSRATKGADDHPALTNEDHVVEGIVWLRAGEELEPARRDIQAKIKELNETAGLLLPGVRLVLYPADVLERRDEPEGRERTLWLYAAFPAGVTLERVSAVASDVRAGLCRRPELAAILSRIGAPEEDTDEDDGPYNEVEFFLTSASGKREAPAGLRTMSELARELTAELTRTHPGAHWNASLHPRDTFMEPFVASEGEQLLRIFGPDLAELGRLAERARGVLAGVPAIEAVTILPIPDRPRFEWAVDPEKCARWGIPVADANEVLRLALDARRITQMVEGEKTCDVVLRWPDRMRGSQIGILDSPVDVPPPRPDGRRAGKVKVGESPLATPRLRLRDVVRPTKDLEVAGPSAGSGPAAIYREEGKRLVAVRFRAARADRAALTNARKQIDSLVRPPYRTEWSGEAP
jgi:Cu/Ag efflux pump CusA